MLWDKSQVSEVRPRSYQGVRVKDPVRELLQRKRSAAPSSSKTTAPTVEVASFTSKGLFTSEPSAAVREGCSGWTAMPTTSCAVQPSFLLRSAPESRLPHTLGPNQSYSLTTTLPTSTKLYVQTLCPSYTMHTYTHTPLLTNFGTVAPVPTHLPQMDSDCGLTYLPWTAMSSPAALSGSPLLHVPLSVPLATMIPQLDLHGPSAESSIQEQPMLSGTESPSEQEVPEIKQESPSLLDTLLEEHKSDNDQHKDLYNNPIYVTNV